MLLTNEQDYKHRNNSCIQTKLQTKSTENNTLPNVDQVKLNSTCLQFQLQIYSFYEISYNSQLHT